MSMSYAVRENYNVQTAIWSVAAFVYRASVLAGAVYRVAVKLAFLLYCTAEMLAVLTWKGKPSLSTMLLVSKALALATLPAVGMLAVFVAPMAVVCVAVLVGFAVVTKPR